jgi:tRNA1(Val) A37 N6-methylase TrmN6
VTAPDLGPLTEDRLLGGRVRIAQPADGYRAAIDPVLLAAFAPARAGERVLDLGAGAGAASLCLAARVPGVRVDGIERDAATMALARANAALNGFSPPPVFVLGDVTALDGAFERAFDHVMANPPYLEASAATPPPDGRRAAAHVEGEADLDMWIDAMARASRHRGTISLVHRADRLDALLAALRRHAGGIVVFPLWPKAGRPAKRVLVRGVKGSRASLVLAPGLVLHEDDGTYTAGTEAVLREAAAIAP